MGIKLIKREEELEQYKNEALFGVSGEIVKAISPETESAEIALLVQLIAIFGNIVYRNVYYLIESTKHFCNLFVVLVSPTAVGRKGTSLRHIKRIAKLIDPTWKYNSGLSSGEGLIHAIRDRKIDSTKKEDLGVDDKRLMLLEEEFGETLRHLSRHGNTLSAVLRKAWDGDELLNTLTKGSPETASNGHVSLVGHITQFELIKLLQKTEAFSGFANRFMWITAKRKKLLPRGGRVTDEMLQGYVERLKEVISYARNLKKEISLSDNAYELWDKIYCEVEEYDCGNEYLQAIINRAAPLIIRIATLYSLLECSDTINVEHLNAAYSLWKYARLSAEIIFTDVSNSKSAEKLVEELKTKESGMTMTEIRKLFGNNKSKDEIEMMLDYLENESLVQRFRIADTGGRPEVRIVYAA